MTTEQYAALLQELRTGQGRLAARIAQLEGTRGGQIAPNPYYINGSGEAEEIGGTQSQSRIALNSDSRARALAQETPMAAPPAITDEKELKSSIANPLVTPAVTGGVQSGPFRYQHSDTVVTGSLVGTLGQSEGEPAKRALNASWCLAVEFDTDAEEFEIWIRAAKSGAFLRLWINEQYCPLFEVSTENNNERYILVKFETAALRRIRIDFDPSAYFGGIVAKKTRTIYAPTTPGGLKLAVVGDSYTAGEGASPNKVAGQEASYSMYGYLAPLIHQLGFTNYRDYAVGGTGFLKKNLPTLTYGERIADVLTYAPDVLLIQNSINDGTLTGGNKVHAAIETYIAEIKAALPATSIFMISPLSVEAGSPEYTAVNTEAKAAALALGIPYADGYTPEWFTGTGTTTNLKGDGNRDFYANGAVGGHPSAAAGAYYAKRLSGLLLPLMAEMP